LVLDPKLTVLVGANNAGKTTVLDALAATVTYRRGAPAFLDTDFRAETTGADVVLRGEPPAQLVRPMFGFVASARAATTSAAV